MLSNIDFNKRSRQTSKTSAFVIQYYRNSSYLVRLINFLKFLTFNSSKTTNSDSPKLKGFAGDNFKFDENGEKFSK